MVPRECEVAIGAEHFDGSKENREECEQVGFPLELEVLDCRVDECSENIEQTEVGDEEDESEEDEPSGCGFHVHHVTYPVVVDGVIDHACPKCREYGCFAIEFVQDDEPRD